MLNNLIREMIDGGTLPALSPDEVDSLGSLAEDNLVPFILELFEGAD